MAQANYMSRMAIVTPMNSSRAQYNTSILINLLYVRSSMHLSLNSPPLNTFEALVHSTYFMPSVNEHLPLYL